MKAIRRWHVHSVDINFGEERGWCCNYGRDENLASLANLAEVTGANKPNNVGLHMGPPETFGDSGAGRIKSFMAYVVVGTAHYVYSFVGVDD
jgi:hypothetical protein